MTDAKKPFDLGELGTVDLARNNSVTPEYTLEQLREIAVEMGSGQKELVTGETFQPGVAYMPRLSLSEELDLMPSAFDRFSGIIPTLKPDRFNPELFEFSAPPADLVAVIGDGGSVNRLKALLASTDKTVTCYDTEGGLSVEEQDRLKALRFSIIYGNEHDYKPLPDIGDFDGDMIIGNGIRRVISGLLRSKTKKGPKRKFKTKYPFATKSHQYRELQIYGTETGVMIVPGDWDMVISDKFMQQQQQMKDIKDERRNRSKAGN